MGICARCEKMYKKDGGRNQKLCLECWTIARTKATIKRREFHKKC